MADYFSSRSVAANSKNRIAIQSKIESLYKDISLLGDRLESMDYQPNDPIKYKKYLDTTKDVNEKKAAVLKLEKMLRKDDENVIKSLD